MYWNASLKQGGISTRGWKQNSLVSMDTVNKTYKYNYEYYLLLKHFGHFVKPGAKRLNTAGSFINLLAFINPYESVVTVVQNESNKEKMVRIKVKNEIINPSLKPGTFNTFLIKKRDTEYNCSIFYLYTRYGLNIGKYDEGRIFVVYNLLRIMNILGMNMLKEYLKALSFALYSNVAYFKVLFRNYSFDPWEKPLKNTIRISIHLPDLK